MSSVKFGFERAKAEGTTWERSKLKVVRIRAGAPTRVTSFSSEAFVAYVHYFEKRTIPCCGEDCPACAFGGSRRYAFLAGVVEREDQRSGVVVVELPGTVFSRVGGLLDVKAPSREGNLLGVCFEVYRVKGLRSPLAVSDEYSRVEVAEIPIEDVVHSVCRMWRIPSPPGLLSEDGVREVWEKLVCQAIRSRHEDRRRTAGRA